ncbi:hypothetical protein RclHR1_03080015 [Rhizophagus clarus]|uniref:Protein kinase domain-containing protein n=1 Tax=Rhizophagus clarus TaxID=94130 RepID=A0A2Z6S0G6_9GLOM|nr:hypothetical protein RclHR1_03080015 [Rhizophagus clarus]
MRFQRNFENWTSGNNNIDKFIRDTQLSAHDNYYMDYALEWIPYDRLRDIKYIAEVELGNINNTCGITQHPETKNYMMVLNNNICKKCNYVCNAMHFQQNFENWTSGNKDIDKFIQDTQLSAHHNAKIALEWIPYDRLIAKEESGKMYSANWIDGNISFWDHINQNWKRINHNMIVILKNLNYLKNILMEFTDEINKPCGITQHSETKNYMIVFNNRCKKCNYACNTMYFKRNFKNWTSGNKDIDKFIQDTQLLSHTEDELPKVLEWIPYDRFCDMKYIAKGGFGKVYKATWIDGIIFKWSNITSNWERNHKNMSVALKSLDNSKNITSEFINEVMLHNKVAIDNLFVISFYGITQDPDTTNYMMVLDYAENGSLRNYLNKKYDELNWNSKIDYIYDVTLGLKKNAKNNTYGVLPYIAPEILRGQDYTKSAIFIVLGAHSEAIYTSRLLDFNNLPEPKNSDDYYEQDDIIISKEFSDSLQIDISQLNFN